MAKARNIPTDDNGPAASVRGKPGLSKAVIVEAAVSFIDTEGIASLSMRRLGKSLGVEGMTLYRYVHNRDVLLDEVVEQVVDQLYADPQMLLQPTDSWQDYVRRVAGGVRRIAQTHPNLFPLVATRPPAAPWVRPPLRSLRWVEGFLVGLQHKGFSDAKAIYAYRAFTSFLLGHLMLEVVSKGVDPVPTAEPTEPAAPPDFNSYPTILRLAPLLAQEDNDQEFEQSLENLLVRIEEQTDMN